MSSRGLCSVHMRTSVPFDQGPRFMTPLNCLSLHAATLGIEASTDESGVGSIRHAAPVTGLYTRTFLCLKHSLFHKLLCIFWASEPTSLPPRSLPELPCLLHTSPHPSTPAPASRGCVSDGSACPSPIGPGALLRLLAPAAAPAVSPAPSPVPGT